MAKRPSRRPPQRARSARTPKTARRPKPRAKRATRPTRATPETLRLRAFAPGLTANDLKRSIAFYTGVLGFVVSERWTADDGTLRGVMLKAGACELGLSQDDWGKGRDRRKGEAVRIWAGTAQDIDALAARIRSRGGVITDGPKDEPWGARSVSFDDPDGFHFTLFRER